MKKIRLWYWIASAFIRKYALGILLGCLIGVLIAIQSDKIIKLLPNSNVLHIGRIGMPNISQIPLTVEKQISKGLTKIEPDGSWKVDVAQNITVSEDGKVYTVLLDMNNKWSDGSKLTSNEIEINIADVVTSKPDEKTIQFTLKEPFAPFPIFLSQPIFKKVKTGKIIKKTQIIGLNEFRIQSIETKNQSLKTINIKSPNQTLIYHFYPTEEDALIAFKLGKVDRIEDVSSPFLENWPHISTEVKDNSGRYLVMFFNFNDQNLQDKSIRQLLAYATPKNTDEENRVISPISKESWAYNPQVKPYNYSLDSAKSIFDKLKKANPKLTTEFTLTTTPAYSDYAQRIIESWIKIGITAQIKIVPYPDPNDYQILLIGQQSPDDPDQYSLWHSTQATNISHYQSPKVDKLLEDGRRELNFEKRKEIYQDFQRFLAEDCPAVFLNSLPTYTMSRSQINLE